MDNIATAPPDEAGPADGLLPMLGAVEGESAETLGQVVGALNGNVIVQNSLSKIAHGFIQVIVVRDLFDHSNSLFHKIRLRPNSLSRSPVFFSRRSREGGFPAGTGTCRRRQNWESGQRRSRP
jgi:hypothetical protein